jgi:hypothetical protein
MQEKFEQEFEAIPGYHRLSTNLYFFALSFTDFFEHLLRARSTISVSE